MAAVRNAAIAALRLAGFTSTASDGDGRLVTPQGQSPSCVSHNENDHSRVRRAELEQGSVKEGMLRARPCPMFAPLAVIFDLLPGQNVIAEVCKPLASTRKLQLPTAHPPGNLALRATAWDSALEWLI